MSKEHETLLKAARELHASSLHPDVLRRGEAAILARVGRPRRILRLLVWGATGLAAGFAGFLLAAAPTKASAAEVLRIAANADRSLRRIRFYEARPDGTLRLGLQMIAQNGRRRVIDANGWQFAYDGRAATTFYADGGATVEHQPSNGVIPAVEGSARDMMRDIMSGANVRIVVRRGLVDEGRRIDRYTVSRDVVDGRGDTLHIRTVLDADPTTERPLAMRGSVPGMPDSLTLWDYPAPDPAIFRLPIPKATRVDDLDAQRAAVLRKLRRQGTRATVGGKTVELLGVMVDGKGDVAAIARADYAYPMDYGLQIDGVDIQHTPEKPPFSGQWAIQEPTPFEGRETQLFWLTRDRSKSPSLYPDRLDVRLPVCEGKRLLGYARFTNVPVQRSYNLHLWLWTDTARPFWDTRPKGEAVPTIAVEDDTLQ